MSVIGEIALAGGVMCASLVGTAQMRRYAIRRRMLDVPNARSSHDRATPRGGGTAIALATLVALPLLGAVDGLPWREVIAITGGGALVTAVGYMDDQFSLPPSLRLLGHFGAAAWMIGWIGGLPPIVFFGSLIYLGWFGDVLATLYLVWMLNLTNFMDGIDGLASVETVTVCSAAAFLCHYVPAAAVQWHVPVVLTSATLGFLVWNWPPAKIFMGDAGSGFLGFMLGALSLCAALSSSRLFWAWMVLVGVFVVDATVTLSYRMVRGERVYEAHRTHAYQHAARRWGSHRRVTLAVGFVNYAWLFPIAILVAIGQVDGLTGVLVAYIPLGIIGMRMGAGKPFVPGTDSASQSTV